MASDENQEQPPDWQERHLYQLGERVTFRDSVWIANHRTVVRPGLTKSWTRQAD